MADGRLALQLAIVALVVGSYESKVHVELTGPHVCITAKNYTKSAVIPVYENEPVIIPFFCIRNWHFRCYVKSYKSVPKYRERLSNQTIVVKKCCNGYENTLDNAHCRPVCSPLCLWGECVAPGTCKCSQYYYGKFCNISKVRRKECPVGYFGFDCSQKCLCQNHGICDQFEGNCNCPPGFTGIHCELPCPQGLYGFRCRHRCKCQINETCSPINGECSFDPFNCEITCSSESNSTDCIRQCLRNRSICDPVNDDCTRALDISLKRNCIPGFFGPDCQYECKCKNGGFCEPMKGGICKCPAGFVGKHCENVCQPGYFGNGCKSKCRCQNDALCDAVNGLCYCRAGYFGKFCSFPCPTNTYGHQCKYKCNCRNGTLCNPVNGLCECPKGFTGKYCNIKAVEKNLTLYWETLRANCNCNWFKAYSCDLSTGKCKCKHSVDGDCQCRPGRTGYDCNTLCPEGTYGLNCKSHCECRNNAKCRASDGVCMCKPGFYGSYCEEVCPHNYYGRMCLSKCDCNKITEICHPVRGCVANNDTLNSGDIGFLRLNENDEQTIWIFNISFVVDMLMASVIVVGVLSAALTGCYFYYHRYPMQRIYLTRKNIFGHRDSYSTGRNAAGVAVIGTGRDDVQWGLPRHATSFADEMFYAEYGRGRDSGYNCLNENLYIEISEKYGDENMYDRLDFLRPTGSWKPHYQCTLSLHDQSSSSNNSSSNNSSRSGKTNK